ncbi:hypothetical protein OG780_11495 [Streptomyces sp. NBC_00386]|uniref:hypothetical protein n=1 Tax=Streptomyces sp. NBC_00386 TaxID=2975734 RepID=UPI002E1E2B63
MDLQGVGAIAAAAVAAVTVVATARSAKSQMEATVHSAEATYRAAVEAAKEQASAAHSQWRREVRREAYVAFLTKARSLSDIDIELLKISHINYDRTAIRDRIERDAVELNNAHLLIELEGPDTVISAAENLVEASVALVRRTHLRCRALDARDYATETAGGDPSHPASRAVKATVRLIARAEHLERQSLLAPGTEPSTYLNPELSEFNDAFDAWGGPNKSAILTYVTFLSAPPSRRESWFDAYGDFKKTARAALD